MSDSDLYIIGKSQSSSYPKSPSQRTHWLLLLSLEELLLLQVSSLWKLKQLRRKERGSKMTLGKDMETLEAERECTMGFCHLDSSLSAAWIWSSWEHLGEVAEQDPEMLRVQLSVGLRHFQTRMSPTFKCFKSEQKSQGLCARGVWPFEMKKQNPGCFLGKALC